MGVGAGGEGGGAPQYIFGQNAVKNSGKKVKKNKCGTKKAKNVQRVYPVGLLQPRAQVSLKRGSRLGLLKSTF